MTTKLNCRYDAQRNSGRVQRFLCGMDAGAFISVSGHDTEQT
jgi:hypothetical protein